jgi:hypothetical protein
VKRSARFALKAKSTASAAGSPLEISKPFKNAIFPAKSDVAMSFPFIKTTATISFNYARFMK